MSFLRMIQEMPSLKEIFDGKNPKEIWDSLPEAPGNHDLNKDQPYIMECKKCKTPVMFDIEKKEYFSITDPIPSCEEVLMDEALK